MRFFEPHNFSALSWETVCDGQRECVARRTTHSLSYIVRDSMREVERMCGSRNRTLSLLFCERWHARGSEYVWFFEPHILSTLSWETVCDGHRECAALRTALSLSCVVRDAVSEAERMRDSKSRTHRLVYFG